MEPRKRPQDRKDNDQGGNEKGSAQSLSLPEPKGFESEWDVEVLKLTNVAAFSLTGVDPVTIKDSREQVQAVSLRDRRSIHPSKAAVLSTPGQPAPVEVTVNDTNPVLVSYPDLNFSIILLPSLSEKKSKPLPTQTEVTDKTQQTDSAITLHVECQTDLQVPPSAHGPDPSEVVSRDHTSSPPRSPQKRKSEPTYAIDDDVPPFSSKLKDCAIQTVILHDLSPVIVGPPLLCDDMIPEDKRWEVRRCGTVCRSRGRRTPSHHSHDMLSTAEPYPDLDLFSDREMCCCVRDNHEPCGYSESQVASSRGRHWRNQAREQADAQALVPPRAVRSPRKGRTRAKPTAGVSPNNNTHRGFTCLIEASSPQRRTSPSKRHGCQDALEDSAHLPASFPPESAQCDICHGWFWPQGHGERFMVGTVAEEPDDFSHGRWSDSDY